MPRYNKEELESVIKSSFSVTESLRKLDLCITGGNHEILKKWCKKWNIDYSHFLTQSERAKKMWKEQEHKRKIPLDEILVKTSTYSRKDLKRRLYETKLKTRECELCGQDEIWHGKRMSLILDHINGVRDDNRIENLRIVCSNCNATLPTHCGKNNKVKVDKRKNPRPNRRKVKNRPPKEELLLDIKKNGYCAVGRKYGVSDNAIRKWLK